MLILPYYSSFIMFLKVEELYIVSLNEIVGIEKSKTNIYIYLTSIIAIIML